MEKEISIKLWPDEVSQPALIKAKARKKLGWKQGALHFAIVKKSLDARKGRPFYLVKLLVSNQATPVKPIEEIRFNYHKNDKKKVIIIGAGPAGYFAALRCVEKGFLPIVLERGKDVRSRRRDLKAIQQDGIVNPDSNYCFGEGGAGTYSDGKLYTRSKKRGKIIGILKILIDHGASPDIGIDAHPHIGSNKLPGIIAKMRETIEEYGGQILFDTKMEDLIIQEKVCKGVITSDGKEYVGDAVILATGHSGREVYKLLHNKGVLIEAKPYALGVRIEHPQALIDEIQFGQSPREPGLPASSYSLVSQIHGCGVFSFCMCPGGLIVPAATSPGELVVNGMSLSKRDSPYANSGIVTALETEELVAKGYDGVFGNMKFQSEVEQKIFDFGDGSQKAPAQNLIDFVNGQDMLDVGDSSYIPGIYRAPLHELLPDFIYERLKQGLLAFSLKMKGYFTSEAKVVAIESRTSAPVRIPRDHKTCQHVQIQNLYPCGEGAGYAGGILSAAMDGQRVVDAIALDM